MQAVQHILEIGLEGCLFVRQLLQYLLSVFLGFVQGFDTRDHLVLPLVDDLRQIFLPFDELLSFPLQVHYRLSRPDVIVVDIVVHLGLVL